MSQANVEIVRRIYEAVARRDAAAVLALYDEEVELDASRLGMFSKSSAVTKGCASSSASGTKGGGRSSTPTRRSSR